MEKLLGPVTVNDFNDASAAKFRRDLFDRELESDMPIIIHIDSYGGHVDSCNSMIDAINSCRSQVITVATGKAMSCGALLLLSGDIRFAAQRSRIMIHEVSSGTGGHVKDMVIDTEAIKKENEGIVEHIAKMMKLKGGVKALKKMFEKQRDLYYSAEEALAAGIVDHIGEPEIVTTVTHNIHISPTRKTLNVK